MSDGLTRDRPMDRPAAPPPGIDNSIEHDRPVTIAILAMGGQGGGVLADWIVGLAETAGWRAQSTSVPGVAQRTGATIYYIEIIPAQAGRVPVLSLAPMPGDVDIVIAAEYMEAGRAMLRGLVTPGRTTLIASTHRALAVSEKEQPGNGTGDSGVVTDAAGVAARRAILFDMEAIAQRCQTMISAAMFGALAGSGRLPFARQAFEAVIAASGRGAAQSRAAFDLAFEAAGQDPRPPVRDSRPAFTLPPRTGDAAGDRLLDRIAAEFPPPAQAMLVAGVGRMLSYQDVAYAHDYLDRVAVFARLDLDPASPLTLAAAKHIANAMSFDDVIHVAVLKTRSSRFDRVRGEIGLASDQLVYTTEFLHPRMAEVIGTLPVAIGRFFENRPRLTRRLDRLVDRGRRIETGRIRGFLALYLVAGLKRWRRHTLRYVRETAHMEAWLKAATDAVAIDREAAIEVLNCRRLVKGYSDTHARGTSKFDRVMAILPRVLGRAGGAEWLRFLVKAALADEAGTTLDGALRTVADNLPPGDAP